MGSVLISELEPSALSPTFVSSHKHLVFSVLSLHPSKLLKFLVAASKALCSLRAGGATEWCESKSGEIRQCSNSF